MILPQYYNNRELSWLDFNKRVLEEASDPSNPFLERLKFLAIFSSNLDEFFMVRVAGLKDQVRVGFKKPENKAGLTPKQQLEKITQQTHSLVNKQYQTFKTIIKTELLDEKIELLTMEKLSSEQMALMECYFDQQIFPVLTPLAVDAYHPFPMLANKSINLAILLQENETTEQELKKAIVQVPSLLNRFVSL